MLFHNACCNIAVLTLQYRGGSPEGEDVKRTIVQDVTQWGDVVHPDLPGSIPLVLHFFVWNGEIIMCHVQGYVKYLYSVLQGGELSCV